MDPAAFAAANRQEAPVRGFTSGLAAIAEDSATDGRLDPVRVNCLLAAMVAWARADALLGEVDSIGANFRIWALVPLATSYNLIAHGIPRDSGEAKQIRAWLSMLADRNLEYVESRRIRNNISYWAAAGAALTSVATQRRDLLAHAINITQRGISSVDRNGLLPGEMRGPRALAYHAFALTPLAIVAEVASANGVDLFSQNNGALLRVGERILAAQYDPSFFEKNAGAKQDTPIPFPAGHIAWAEILYRHHPTPPLAQLLRERRPIRFDRAGGNTTFLFGKPLPSGR